jgi:serine/threonine protein kinase
MIKLKWYGNTRDFMNISHFYYIQEQIGSGAFSKVYSGKNIKSGEIVAIKVFEKRTSNKQ